MNTAESTAPPWNPPPIPLAPFVIIYAPKIMESGMSNFDDDAII
jgi:hypothetical protein